MVTRDEIVAYADALLEVERWQEFGPAGLQVVGADEVTRIACGVSSSLELFERAARAGARARDRPPWALLAQRAARGRPPPARHGWPPLFAADISLVAYHLALDAHPEVGNNAQLARTRSGSSPSAPSEGSASAAAWRSPVSIEELAGRVRERGRQREPLVFAEGHDVASSASPCRPARRATT